ncbi:MAG: ATP-binding protein [Verrucomicrobiota bacterium]
MPRSPTLTARETIPAIKPPEGRLTSRWLALPPGRVAVFAALICFATAAVALGIFYENARRLLKENLRDGLRAGASMLATAIDPEIHRALTNPEQENSMEYIQATARMEAVRRALNTGAAYRFVYTCIRKPEGVYFVLDPTPEGDADGDGVEDKSHIGDFYAEANPRLRRVFDTGVADVDEDPVVDTWGSALSGYAPIRDAAGKVIAVAGVDLELTAYNARIANLRQVGLSGVTGAAVLSCLAGFIVKNYHRRLQKTVTSLVSAMHQARAGERAKSEFLATVSHELRTPLNGILGMVELLGQTPLNARQREQADTIHRSGDLLQLIIDDILDWSGIESGSLEITRAAVNLKSCLREVIDWFTPLAVRKGLTFEVTEEEGCPLWFESDPAHLRQVLMHLTGNAVKFTSRGGVRVTVSHETAGPGREARLIFTIRDTGIGIRPDQREKIFQPFSQGDSTTTRHYGGTGLGLAISRRLCHAMGGEITVRSELRQGSEFTFYIRCVPVTPPPDSESEKTLPVSAGAGPVSASKAAREFPGRPVLPSASAVTGAGSDTRPVLLVSPDRMLVQLSSVIFKRMELPLEHCSGLDAACGFLASTGCRAVLLDTAQIEGWGAASPAALREAAGADHPVRLIALLMECGARHPAGCDDVICRRLRMDDLEAVLHFPPAA